MKEYNVKIIADNDELKICFECDKEKNKECKGNGNCRECNFTTNAKYMKARERMQRLEGKNITDKQIIENLQDEIDGYRNGIRRLVEAQKKDKELIDNANKLIKEYQDIFKYIIFNEETIFKTKTANQIRNMLGLKKINNKNKVLDKQFEITIKKEEYLIRYNNNTDIALLNAYLINMVNEQEIDRIIKNDEFEIINKTRLKRERKELDDRQTRNRYRY